MVQIARESVERAKPFLISSVRKGQYAPIQRILDSGFPIDEPIDN